MLLFEQPNAGWAACVIFAITIGGAGRRDVRLGSDVMTCSASASGFSEEGDVNSVNVYAYTASLALSKCVEGHSDGRLSRICDWEFGFSPRACQSLLRRQSDGGLSQEKA